MGSEMGISFPAFHLSSFSSSSSWQRVFCVSWILHQLLYPHDLRGEEMIYQKSPGELNHYFQMKYELGFCLRISYL